MKDPGSFRDPSGFVFFEKNKVFRAIHNSYKENYDFLVSSGLYKNLTDKNLLVKHELSEQAKPESICCILEVERVFPINYPYEWSFSQLRDAAILTLEIQKISVEHGMLLKDATPYNVQFQNNSPIFIDTLSFEKIVGGNHAWKAYKQFNEMFLSPLCLMSYKDPSLNKLLIPFLDGIPLSITNKLLPLKKKFSPTIFTNLVLPNFISSQISSGSPTTEKKISKQQHLNIIEQLLNYIRKMKIIEEESEWGEYNFETISEKEGYVKDKELTVESLLNGRTYDVIWDIGSNDGYYSRKVGQITNGHVMSIDIDWNCVEKNYLINQKKKIDNVTPILADLSNPSPGIGWMNKERSPIYSRIGEPGLICLFAVIHHIINRNVPIDFIIDFIAKSSKHVLIEYVPLSDPKSQIIFASRGDEFTYPSQEEFEEKVSGQFNVVEKKKLAQTDRILFLLKKKT